MRNFIIIILSLILIGGFSVCADQELDDFSEKSKSNFFIENKGRWNSEVKFLARIGGMNAWITDEGVVYDFYKITRHSIMEDVPHFKSVAHLEKDSLTVKGHVVKMSFDRLENRSSTAGFTPQGQSAGNRYEVQGKNKLEAYYNYFIGNDESKWASYVGLYKEVIVKNVYDGIDYRFYFENGLLRYDLNVQPFADLEQIRMKYEGQEGLEINDNGELVIKTSIGDVKNQKIYAYQNKKDVPHFESVAHLKDTRQEIPVRFTRHADGTIGFSTGNYDKSLALTIDPLVYSTFIGGGSGTGDDYAHSIALDGSNNAYIAGWTSSTDYPTTSGAYDESFNGGTDRGDVIISKLNSNGTDLVYSTFIGGSADEKALSIALDGSNNAYIAGRSESGNYPTTSGAYDETHNGGGKDVILTKLNSSGSALIYSTFIGGSGIDEANSIVLDALNNAYITGFAWSEDFPTTSEAYDTSANSYWTDVFITKVDSSGSDLVYSTYLGGDDYNYGNAIAVDNSYNAYITGRTRSTNFPTTSGAYDTTHSGGQLDAFVTKLNSSGSELVYSTYIGGNLDESGVSIALDASNNAYITGNTNSDNYPTTSGAYDESHNGAWTTDAFVTKLNSDGSDLIYSTYIGGGSMDEGYSLVLDGSNNVFLLGDTESSDFPVTSGAYDESYNDWDDVFVVKLSGGGSDLNYSTFIGGDKGDYGESIALDGSNNVYIVGGTDTTDYPTTSGAYDETFNGGSYDAFVTKLDLSSGSTASIATGTVNSSYCQNEAISIPYTATGTFNPGNGFTAQLSDDSGDFSSPDNIGSVNSTSSGTISGRIPSNSNSGGAYRVRVVSSNPSVVGGDNGEDITINALPSPSIDVEPDTVCANNISTHTGNSEAGVDNKWKAIGGTISGGDDGETVSIIWETSSSGTVTLTQTNTTTGCIDSVSKEITINPLPYPEISGDEEVCENNTSHYSTTLTANHSYEWFVEGGEIQDSTSEAIATIIWGGAGEGSVKLVETIDATGCKDSIELSVTINPLPSPSIIGATNVCSGCSEIYSTESEPNERNNWIVARGNITDSSAADTIEVLWDDVGAGEVKLIQENTETGCVDSAEIDITISEFPRASISGDTVVCEGDVETYVTNSNPDIEKRWYASGGEIEGSSTLYTVEVAWGEPGTGNIKVVLRDDDIGYLDSTEMTVVINEIPEVNFDCPIAEVCLDDPAFDLTGGGTEGGEYSGNGVSDGRFNPSVAGAGEHILTYSYSENGCENSDADTIIVHPLPEKPEISEESDSLISTAANAYQWYLEDEIIEGANSQYYEPTEAGFYKVEITDENGCKNMSDPHYYDPTGVENKQTRDFNLSAIPNPFTGTTTISYTLNSPAEVGVTITNIMGAEVASLIDGEYRSDGRHSVDFEASDLPAGVYFCRFSAGGFSETVKLMITK